MTRIDAILADPTYEKYLELNNLREAERKFCRHTFQHFVDVARIAYILMLEGDKIKAFMQENDLNQKLAKELIYAAALLHDIGRWKEYETGADHAVVSAELAEEILRRAGFAERERKVITTGIKEHRGPGSDKSILGGFLCRADDLSRMCTRCAARADCYKYEEMETGNSVLIY